MSWKQRRERASLHIKEHKLDFLLVEDPVDLFYLTGEEVSAGKLLVGQQESLFFVDARYFDAVQQKADCTVCLYTEKKFQAFLAQKPYRIGIDADKTSHASFVLYQESLSEEIVPLKRPLDHVRMIKEPVEIEKLERAISVHQKAYQALVGEIQEGVTEKEVAYRFECLAREYGAEKLSFEPIVAFGEHSAYPHYHSSDTRLQPHQVVLLDLGVLCEHYASDMTRVLFVDEASAEMQKMHSLVQEAYEAAFDAIQIGEPVTRLDQAARAVFKKAGYEAFFTHSLGHGIGLEVHELPSFRSSKAPTLIQPHMVFTLEPGLYRKGIGGIRFENMICITETGAVNLSS